VLDVGTDDAGGRLRPERPKSSFSTISVTSPTPRSKTAVCSNIGVSIRP
jgi:hypothetical protein